MNYLKIYRDLMICGNRKKFLNSEKHHIIPKSIYNDKKVQSLLNNNNLIKSVHSKTNLVYLTLRQHFVSHVLLLKIFKSNKNAYNRMLYAYNFLSNRSKCSRRYSKYKRDFIQRQRSVLLGKPSRHKGCKWTIETRLKKLQSSKKGLSYEDIYGVKKAKELKKAKKIVFINNWIDPEIRKSLISKLKNRKITWGKAISSTKKGIPMSDIAKRKISNFMSDYNKNPNVDQTYYNFVHKITKEKISARRIDMKRKYGCKSIHKVIDGRRSHCNNWSLEKNEK